MLENKIYQDYVEALKSKNKVKSEFLSFIRAQLKNAAIDLKKDKLDDNEALSVIKKQQKRLNDSKESILSSKREDLLQQVEKEITLLNQYLPEPMSDAELTKIIEKIIADTQSSSMKDMGKVMKEVLAQTGAKADSKTVSSLVKMKLSSK